MGRVDGKVALVTGASRGTGEQTARLLVAEGARVVIADVLEEEGRAVAAALGDAARFERLDVTDEDSWNHVVERTTGIFGAPTILVNNAGLLHIESMLSTTPADMERLWRVNQLGPFLGMRAVARAMGSAGGGSIVNVASVDGLSAKNGIAAYASTKWGLRGLTRVAALELGQLGIRVNTVCPEAGGPAMRRPFTPEAIDPATTLAFTHDVIPRNQTRSALEIIGDIAHMILFLASDESLSCTGADYAVDAGWTAGRRMKFQPGYRPD